MPILQRYLGYIYQGWLMLSPLSPMFVLNIK